MAAASLDIITWTPQTGEAMLSHPGILVNPDIVEGESSAHAGRFATHLHGFKDKLVDVREAIGDDVESSERPHRTIWVGRAVVANQIFGMTKLPSAVITPMITMQVLASSGSPELTGLSGAAVSGALTYIGARTLASGVDHYPQAMSAVASNFPVIQTEITKMLPGLEAPQPTEQTRGQLFERFKKVMRFMGRNLCRGVTGYNVGTSPYILASAAMGKPPEDQRRLSGVLGWNNAAVIGLASSGVAELVTLIGQNEPTAQFIQRGAGNPLTWYAMAILAVGGKRMQSWRQERKQAQQAEGAAEISLVD